MILLTILTFVLLIAAGYCRGIFECVTLMKSMRKHWHKLILVHGELFEYWSYELFVFNKDRNNDGKASYLEKTFPNDGGHRIKLLELFLYSAAICTFSFCDYNIYYLPAFFIAFWFAISLGFSISFDKYKK